MEKNLAPCFNNLRNHVEMGTSITAEPKIVASVNSRCSLLLLRSFFLMFVLFLGFSITSCSEEEIFDEDVKDEDVKDEITISDISGIWENIDNDLFFISLGSDNKYSFCFTPTLMGSGKYELQNDSIIFYNEYLSTTDKAKVEIENSILKIEGDFMLFKSDNIVKINIVFQHSDEDPTASIIGEQWKSNKILSVGGDQREYLDVLNQYIIKYRRVKANGIETPLKEQNWFYINRKDLLYTQISNGNGKIYLYESPFIYNSLLGISSYEISFTDKR